MQLSGAGGECGREAETDPKGKGYPRDAGEMGTQKTYKLISPKAEKCFEILLIALISEVFKESTDLLKNRRSGSKKAGKGGFDKPAPCVPSNT